MADIKVLSKKDIEALLSKTKTTAKEIINGQVKVKKIGDSYLIRKK